MRIAPRPYIGPGGRGPALIGLLGIEVLGIFILATQTPDVSGPDPFAYAAQYGVLGLVLIMLLTGYLWAKPSVDEMRNRQEADRKLWTEEAIPAIKDLTKALEGVQTELRRQHESR